jgi:hypothetical protein
MNYLGGFSNLLLKGFNFCLLNFKKIKKFVKFKFIIIKNLCFLVHVKGKAVPLQAWGGPEDSRKLRFPDFMTTAQYCGKFVSLTHRPPLPPENIPGTHFC